MRLKRYLFLIIIAGSILLGEVARAEYVFVRKWGLEERPQDVEVDKFLNVYVAGGKSFRIQKFDATGNFLTKWGSLGSGDGQFNWPGRVMVDDSGNVYVADRANHRIQKFDADGNFLMKWGTSGSGNGQFNLPLGLAIDNTNNIYVADTGNNRIQKFDINGNFIMKWGTGGSGDGQFSSPTGLAISNSGNVYVSDRFNHRIQKFDTNGNFLAKWGSGGSANSMFSQPLGLAIDSAGNVFVADVGNDRIQKFDANGNFITKWGAYGSSDGKLNYPQGVAVDNLGNVYVADTLNRRIQVFEPTNQPPVANAGPDQTVDVGEDCTVEVTLDGSTSTDPDDNISIYAWYEGDPANPANLLNSGEIIDVSLGLGEHIIALVVIDIPGLQGQDEVKITVVDEMPPVLSVNLSGIKTRKRKVKETKVEAIIQATDNCTAAPSIKLEEIKSSAVTEADYGTDDREFKVRTKQARCASPITYKAIYSATDESGNRTEAQGELRIPLRCRGK